MNYYDAKSEKRHNNKTLKNAGLTPSSPGVFPLTTDKPGVDSVFEFCRDSGDVELLNTGYRVKYNIVQRPLDDIKESLQALVNQKTEINITQGVKVDFGQLTARFDDGTEEEAGERYLQTRDEDKINWLCVLGKAQYVILNGQPDSALTDIRTSDNAVISVTAKQAAEFMLTALDGISANKSESWKRKAQVEQAQNYEELKALVI